MNPITNYQLPITNYQLLCHHSIPNPDIFIDSTGVFVCQARSITADCFSCEVQPFIVCVAFETLHVTSRKLHKQAVPHMAAIRYNAAGIALFAVPLVMRPTSYGCNPL